MRCDAVSKGRPMRTPLLECRHVRCGYDGRPVLKGISLTLEPGAFAGVIGPNGSGKSTLIKALACILQPWEGVVAFHGRDMAELSRSVLAREIAVVSQEEPPAFGFTVAEEVMQGRAPHHGGLHFESRTDRTVMEKALERTEVSHLADRRTDALSGGERQRVRIARSLAQQPRVLLLDEPTNHLDLYAQLSLIELLHDIRREGIAILMVSHDIDLVARLCEHVKILSHGVFLAAGTPQEVITEENLARAFQVQALVDVNPLTSVPRITPTGRLGAADSRGKFEQQP